MIQRILIFTSFILLCTNIVAQSDNVKTPLPDIKNLHKVDQGVYRCSQPNKEQFLELEKIGFKEILNLRRYHSDNKDAVDTQLVLHHIKIRAEAVNEKHLLKALSIIKKRKGAILIHCHHGSDRTGAVVAMYRIVFQGWTKQQAIEEMKNGGYGFHGIYQNIPKLIEKIDIDSFKEKLSNEK